MSMLRKSSSFSVPPGVIRCLCKMDKETPIHAEIGSVARLIKCYKPGGEGYRSIPSYNDDDSEELNTALLFICANFGAPRQVAAVLL